MEALKNLIANVPDWSKRLDELSHEIDKRQLELAQTNSPPSPRSVRPRGSTESLKPTEDSQDEQRPSDRGEAQPTTTADGLVSSQDQPLQHASPTETQPNGHAPIEPISSPVSSQAPVLSTSLALQQQTRQAMAAAQAKARATVRRRHRSDSVISGEGATPKFRTRSMIIVYYDSYVQSFFEELVRFVSASRNLMRKAKMAAKVAQIQRLAEIDLPEPELTPDTPKEDAQNGQIAVDPAKMAPPPANGNGVAPSPANGTPTTPLQFTSTRQMRQMSRTSALLAAARGGGYSGGSKISMAMGRLGQPPDVYDELDKGLEYVQSMCEHAAHQFLRDGDCNEEIDNVKRRLGETRDLAEKEMERVLKEDPDALNKPAEEAGGVTKFRSFRPLSVRRELVASDPPEKTDSGKMEVDEGIDDMEGEAPNLVFKTTRMMR